MPAGLEHSNTSHAARTADVMDESLSDPGLSPIGGSPRGVADVLEV